MSKGRKSWRVEAIDKTGEPWSEDFGNLADAEGCFQELVGQNYYRQVEIHMWNAKGDHVASRVHMKVANA